VEVLRLVDFGRGRDDFSAIIWKVVPDRCYIPLRGTYVTDTMARMVGFDSGCGVFGTPGAELDVNVQNTCMSS
jgi:hypothetical protein